MKKVLLFLADGFEEIEALGTVDLLRRAGIAVTIAGVGTETPTGAHGVKVFADECQTKINAADYDAVVCPGGMPGAENLKNSKYVIAAVQSAHSAGKLVAAICAAPMVLCAAGVLKGKKFTMYPSMETMIKDAVYDPQFVVKDGKITTGKGPAATYDFAFSIIEQLVGKAKLDEVKAGALFK